MNALMYDKETRDKIASCKALQGISVLDFCHTERFMNNLGAYIEAQRQDRKAIQASYQAMRKMGGAKGYKLPAHPIDRLMDLSVEQFRDEFCACINRNNQRPVAQRKYIWQLGMQAYDLTVAQIVIDEFPELESILIPKTNQS